MESYIFKQLKLYNPKYFNNLKFLFILGFIFNLSIFIYIIYYYKLIVKNTNIKYNIIIILFIYLLISNILLSFIHIKSPYYLLLISLIPLIIFNSYYFYHNKNQQEIINNEFIFKMIGVNIFIFIYNYLFYYIIYLYSLEKLENMKNTQISEKVNKNVKIINEKYQELDVFEKELNLSV